MKRMMVEINDQIYNFFKGKTVQLYSFSLTVTITLFFLILNGKKNYLFFILIKIIMKIGCIHMNNSS